MCIWQGDRCTDRQTGSEKGEEKHNSEVEWMVDGQGGSD